MVLYALAHEDLHYRPLRRRVGLPEESSSGLEVTGQNAYSRPARDLRRDLQRLEKRLPPGGFCPETFRPGRRSSTISVDSA